MTFATDEKPGVVLVQQETFYQVGENEILFALKGNYLRPERTTALLNGVTINIDLTTMYQAKNKMFTVKSDQFVSGKNTLTVTAENLVNTYSESFELVSDATELLVKNNYPYPNPARVKANPLLSFSYVLSREANVNIKVYNLNGLMIKEFSVSKGLAGGKVDFNAIPWDGVDQFGNDVANGLYLYVLTVNDGQNKIVQKKKVGILL